MNHRVFDAVDAVVGEQVWNFADFATSSTSVFRVDGNKKGVFTRDRRPKAAAHVLRRRWTTQAMTSPIPHPSTPAAPRPDPRSRHDQHRRCLRPDHHPQHRPDRRPSSGSARYLGYAAGDAGNNLAFSMTSMFLLLYYTDVVGISAAAAGTLFLVVRVWDAFADIWAGRQVDKTMTRWGKFRPFFLFGSLPLLLLSVATFTVPGGLGGTGKLIYAYVTYALLGLAYSLVNIPYGSLASAMTQEPVERARLASFRLDGHRGDDHRARVHRRPADQELRQPRSSR